MFRVVGLGLRVAGYRVEICIALSSGRAGLMTIKTVVFGGHEPKMSLKPLIAQPQILNPINVGGRIKGTLGDIDPLNKVPLKRARSRVQKGYALRGLPNTTSHNVNIPEAGPKRNSFQKARSKPRSNRRFQNQEFRIYAFG